MSSFGFSESEVRRFIERELRQREASTSFYWESEEAEELLELVVEVVGKLIVANNKKFSDDMKRDFRSLSR
jgi:hypothetical protein